MLEPRILTQERTIQVVTGYNQVAVGIIEVPEVTWVETTITEQVGTAKVKVGTKYNTMDVTLTQTSYYNAQGGDVREFFIEGEDYNNADDGADAHHIVDWSGIAGRLGLDGVSAPSGDYKNVAYKTFDQLDNNQRQIVLSALGYMPVYDCSYANAQVYQTLNGTPTVQTWSPSWAGQENVIYRVDVDGWRDKYIRMPKGAQDDVLRVVSQGEPQYLTGDTTLNGNGDGSWWTRDRTRPAN